MAVTRKYHVRHRDDAGNVTRERIISAETRAGARNHATNTTISVDLLTADEAIRLTRAGVVEEEVTGESAKPEKDVHPDQQALPMDAVAAPTGERPLQPGEFNTH